MVSRRSSPERTPFSFSSKQSFSSPRGSFRAMTTHFSGMEKIFFVPDTSFFAAEMSFSAAEKTAGAVPAGLFLNHQLFNVRLAFAFGRRTGMEVRHGTTSQTRTRV